MITCPRCGYQSPDGTPFCPRCGFGRPQIPMQQPAYQQIPTDLSGQPECQHVNDSVSKNFSLREIDPAVLEKLKTLDNLQLANEKLKKDFDKQRKEVIFLLVALLVCIFVILAMNANNVTRTNSVKNRPEYEKVITSLQQTIIAFESQPTQLPEIIAVSTDTPMSTDILEPTVTPTEKASVPNFCKDKQMDIIRIANVLDTQGFPYPGDYDPNRNACIYRISDTDSFLNMGVFGYLTIMHDDNEIPYGAIVDIDYKDNDAVREMITDWGATALAYLDDSQNALTASSLIKSIQITGYGETDNYGIYAGLNTDSMIYQIGVVDINTLNASISN